MSGFTAIVVATDFSAAAAHAAERAARLPLAADARITLLHVVESSPFSSWGEPPRHDAEEELARVRASVAAEVPPGVTVAARVVAGTPYVEIARAARAAGAELVVLGRTGRNAVREHLLGSTAEQVVRNGAASVLLARSARVEPYLRVLCAVEVGGAAPEIVHLARRVAPALVGPVSLVHVYDSPLEGMFFPRLAPEKLDHYRRRHREHARALLTEELVGAGLERPSWALALRHGAPRGRIPEEVARLDADLLALGTHARRGAAYALLGSVAGDVLRAVSCDTLVVRTAGVRVRRP